ncbi:MAG TPA: PhoH family protein [Gammaproteobacteria bacterium]|nr:PhoH family protein [Gammaproteobacteria bacterium]
MKTKEFQIDAADNEILANLLGVFDKNLRVIEKALSIEIKNRGNIFLLSGSTKDLIRGEKIIKDLYITATNENLSEKKIHLLVRKNMGNHEEQGNMESTPDIKTPRRAIKTQGKNQSIYIKTIRENDLCFGIGPAGTGKTYLAVAAAIEALQKQVVSKIILVRPAVEAGERLGFLPGDLSQKVDPYLRPMYDALYEMLGIDQVNHLIERRAIELAPLAFMRGRSLNDSFIILDEAQNTTVQQMKMFLTRMGFGSKSVINGDITQIDLPTDKVSGLKHAVEVLDGIEGIGIINFNHSDVVRHKVVQNIVEAYEKHER